MGGSGRPPSPPALAHAPGNPGRGSGSVGAWLARQARTGPDRVYVESVAQAARLTFGDMDGAANRLARFLRARGVTPGDRVSVLADNSLELVVLFFGLQRYGATVSAVNVEVSANNVGQMLHDVEPRLVLWSRAVPESLQTVVASTGLPAVAFGERNATSGPDLLAMLAEFSAAPLDAPEPDPGALAIINYTSGTTARPKGVCVSHAAYVRTCDAMAERLGLDPTDRLLECRALSWASPQTLTLGPSLCAGATLVLARKFSRSHFFDWIRRYEVTIAAGVPAIINMLCERPEPVTAADVPSLRFVTSSSSPLGAERQREFERRYGIPIVQGAGMTEMTGFMAMNPPAAPRLGSIGPPMPYVRARFVDEAGAICEPRQEGELVVGGPCMASAYLTDRDTLVPIPRDGFRTGDLGYMHRDGYIHITGRRKDLIIRGGVNIAPMEITSALLAHPLVVEAATIGVPDAVYGEAIVSFVAPRPREQVTAVELLAHCRTRLSAFKVPYQILVLDEIPKNDRGKVARETLEAIWQRSAAAVPGGNSP